jgi:hypothetical protein
VFVDQQEDVDETTTTRGLQRTRKERGTRTIFKQSNLDSAKQFAIPISPDVDSKV